MGRLGWTYETLLDTPLPVIEAAIAGRNAFASELIEALLSPFVKKKRGTLISDSRKKLTKDERRKEVARRLRGLAASKPPD